MRELIWKCIFIFQTIKLIINFLRTMIFLSFADISSQIQWSLYQAQNQYPPKPTFDRNSFLNVLQHALQKSLQNYSQNYSPSQFQVEHLATVEQRVVSAQKQNVLVSNNNFSTQNKQQETPKSTINLADQQVRRESSEIPNSRRQVERSLKENKKQQNSGKKKKQIQLFRIQVNRIKKRMKNKGIFDEDKDQQVLMPYKNPKTCGAITLPKLGALSQKDIQNKLRRILRRKVNDWLALEDKTTKRR